MFTSRFAIVIFVRQNIQATTLSHMHARILGAEVDARNQRKASALHLAAAIDRDDISDLLICFGACVNGIDLVCGWHPSYHTYMAVSNCFCRLPSPAAWFHAPAHCRYELWREGCAGFDCQRSRDSPDQQCSFLLHVLAEACLVSFLFGTMWHN